MTIKQIRAKRKNVTRRMGWRFLKAGHLVLAVEKGMGLKKGEKHVPICVIEAVDVRLEPLDRIDAMDCRREGFPHLTPAEFVAMFCRANRCKPGDEVTRIEFRYPAEEG